MSDVTCLSHDADIILQFFAHDADVSCYMPANDADITRHMSDDAHFIGHMYAHDKVPRFLACQMLAWHGVFPRRMHLL
jgi:hypothetical protein